MTRKDIGEDLSSFTQSVDKIKDGNLTSSLITARAPTSSISDLANARDVRIAVLAEKLHDRRVEDIAADWIGVQVPDAYVFGYGMDYHEQGRNLPAIYAL